MAGKLERWHYTFKDNQILATVNGEAMNAHIKEAVKKLTEMCVKREEQWIIQSMGIEALIKLQDLVEGELKKAGISVTCKCNCGYRCGGPGKCELFAKDVDGMLKCIEKHFVRDCEHDWSGEFVYFNGGGSVTCKNCGMTAADHDCAVGP